MKNRIKTRIPVILIAMLALFLAACSCAKPEPENEAAEMKSEAVEAKSEPSATAEERKKETAEKQEADITGQYEIAAMITEGEETPAEDLALLKGKGLNCTITLESDGTGLLDLFGEETEITWDEGAVSTGDKKMPYTFRDGQLTLEDGNSSLTFSRKSQ